MVRTKCLFLFLIFTLCMNAQDFSLKYGKVTPYELTMSGYQEDTTACAVILYEQGEISYDFIQGDFKVVHEYKYKIKILKQEGIKYADIAIPYYSEKDKTAKEKILKLEACAYNSENGKVIKTPLKKDYIFEEQVSPTWKHTKFSIPAVKEGTVIEYQYKVLSDFYYLIPTWEIQQEIPVKYAHLEVRIPEFFIFNIATKGYEKIYTEDTSINENFRASVSGQPFSIPSTSRMLTFTSADVPALKDEDYVWCSNDFMSQVTFELHGIQMPYEPYKPYSRTWKDIEETLKNSSYFGGYLNMRNPYKDEIKKLKLDTLETKEKIHTLFHFLKGKIAWNKKYGFSGADTKQAIKNGIGTNAEFNFVLLSLLKDEGIECNPILLRLKSKGRLPISHPSLDQVSTFIVGAKDTDSTMVYMDGSIIYGDINTLPSVLMVDKARVFDSKTEEWVDLTRTTKSSISTVTTASIDEEGTITGKRQTSYRGEFSSIYKEAFYQAKDSIAFIEKQQTEDEMIINECQQEMMDKLSSLCKETILFNKTTMATDDYIYLNPMLFPHISKNSFTQEKRKLPIEFPFPYTLRQIIMLTIPENYTVEEIPQSLRFSTEDKSIQCLYSLVVNENQVKLSYDFKLNRILFTQDEYDTLKTFWETLVKKNTEQIVLKKNKD